MGVFFFLITGKNQIHFIFIIKLISTFCKTIGQFCCAQYVVRFLRELFSTQFLIFWRKKSVCPNKSSFRSLDLCENQWLSLVHDIYDNFDQNPIFFFCLGFLLYTQTIHRTTGEGRGHFYSSITFTRSWTFIHVFANLLLKWLLRIFNCSACNYQVVTRWDLTMGNRYLIWMLDR